MNGIVKKFVGRARDVPQCEKFQKLAVKPLQKKPS